MTVLNFFLNSITNISSKQAHVQGFDYDSIAFKKAVNMFEHMKKLDSIYEGVLETSYKKYTMEDSTRNGHSRQKRGEVASSHSYSETSESSGKIRKRCVK